MARLLNWLRYKDYQIWGTGKGFLILLFFAVSMALSAFFSQKDSEASRKTTPEIAVITGFGDGSSKYYPGRTFVSAQDSEGLVGGTSVQPYQLAGCKVGDQIRAERYGIALNLDPAPCPITVGPSSAKLTN